MNAIPRKLTLGDIADVRAYERERDAFRQRVIELKRRRRVHVGTLVTFVFENRDTIRFQIQEMARVEKLATDAEIQGELDIYNPMIPERGQLCATMFIELTSDAQVHEWLPKLAGIERSVGSVDDSYDNALAGTINGLNKTASYPWATEATAEKRRAVRPFGFPLRSHGSSMVGATGFEPATT